MIQVAECVQVVKGIEAVESLRRWSVEGLGRN